MAYTPAAHRYWRVSVQGTDSGSAVQIAELQFRSTAGGANVAVGGTPLSNTGSPASAFDGSGSTYWQGAAASGSWLGYDFGSAKSIVEVWMQVPSASPANGPNPFVVEWSDDNSTWYGTYPVSMSAGAWASFTSTTPPYSHAFSDPGIVALPVVNLVTPNAGVPAGGTNVTIYGYYFTDTPTTIKFGGVAVTSVVVANDTTITCQTPAHTAGAVDVVVTNANGSTTLTGGFTYASPPTISSVSPVGGPTTGGTQVTLKGTGLTGATGVTVGGTAATSVVVVDDNTITCQTPAHAVGAVDVVCQGATLAAGFAYIYTPSPSKLRINQTLVQLGSTQTFQFSAQGGTGTGYTWSSDSGTTIDAATGLYTAPTFAVSGGGEYVWVTDSLGNVAGAYVYQSTTLAQWMFNPWCNLQNTGGTVTGHYTYAPPKGRMVFSALASMGVTPYAFGWATDPADGSTISASGIWTGSSTASNEQQTIRITDSTSGTPITQDTSIYISAALSAVPSNPTVYTHQAVTFMGSGGSGEGYTFALTANGSGATIDSSGNYVAGATPGSDTVQVTDSLGNVAATTVTVTLPPTPNLSSLSPTTGSTAGGTNVTIYGLNFTGSTGVTFGGVAATSVVVVGDTTITCTTPAHAAGAVDVVVQNPGGSATLAVGFTYVPGASVTSVSPTTGSTAGGTPITITGTGFTNATGVVVGGQPVSNFVVVGDTSVTCTTPAGTAGAADVTVQSPYGNSTRAGAFTYSISPAVTLVAPGSGPAGGGTVITLTGTGFTGATGVKLGAVAATNFAVVNDTTITCKTPAHAAGAVDVTVQSPYGNYILPGSFTYVAAPGSLAISPVNGSTAGGTNVTVTGTGFLTATGVTIGGQPVTNLALVSDTTITCTTPAHAAGAVDVVVQNPGGSATLASGFLYVSTPAPTAASPTNLASKGGTVVAITGTSLTGTSAVLFGGAAATNVVVVNDTRVTCTAPAHIVGTVDVVVQNLYGMTTMSAAVTYQPGAAVTGVSPATGSTLGNDPVTIMGTGLTGSTGVTFGGAAATNVVVVNDTTITCNTPALALGGYDVVVQNPLGNGLLPGGFQYVLPSIIAVPNAGSPLGGNIIALNANADLFSLPVEVAVDGIIADQVVLVSSRQVTCRVPATTRLKLPALVDIIVRPPMLQPWTISQSYTYNAPPSIASVTPSLDYPTGGSAVSIVGQHFTGAVGVTIGGVPATNVVVVSDTTITCISPAHAVGVVDVVVQHPYGNATLVQGFAYTDSTITLDVSGAAALAVSAEPTENVGRPFMWDIDDLPVTEVTATIQQPLEAQHSYRQVVVDDASQFPDQAGFLVFGFGSEVQTAPVAYVGRAGNVLLLDPTFRFPLPLPVGCQVNLLASRGSVEPVPGEEDGFWVTDSPAGRVAALQTIDDIAVAGYDVQKTVKYPGDVGLAGQGLPTHGQQRLNSVVTVFGGNDLDAEVEAAQEE